MLNEGALAWHGRELPLAETAVSVAGREWRLLAVPLDDLNRIVGPEADGTTFPHGLLFWPMAVELARRLAETPELAAGRRVLELGAGVGLPGMVASSLGAAVTQTDYEEPALALTRLNCEANCVSGITHLLGDWNDFPHPGPFDLVLGSDVLYKAAMRPVLAALLERILAPGGTALFADRAEANTHYFGERLLKMGWSVEYEGREGYFLTAMKSEKCKMQNERREGTIRRFGDGLRRL